MCTREDFGFEEGQEDKPMFYPVHENSLRDAEFYQRKLKCIDERIEILGDYSSAKARVLKIIFEKCDQTISENNCHTDDQITRWLQRKFIMVV